jgi:hypothetical protein
LETALDRYTSILWTERLLAEIRTKLEEMGDGHKELMAIVKTGQEKYNTSDLEANREKSRVRVGASVSP